MVNLWNPPGKNCGACGSQTCSDFVSRLEAGLTESDMCPFYSTDNIVRPEKIVSRENSSIQTKNISYSGVDVTGKEYDFVLLPFPDEPSARKFIVPFRADLVEKWDIKKETL
jgi:uncharacterized Fe-S cluster-containing protein